MAENTVNINLSLLDQQRTIQQRTAEVEKLNKQLSKTQSLASGAFSGTGTQAGAQALRSTESPNSMVRTQQTVVNTGLQDNSREHTNPQPRRSGYRSMGAGGGGGDDYTRAGGVTGRGGASARDFADEARGLGGLVRLYANWAANIFAVSAAFNALREAMATDMLLKGLDQLGASSGIALGGLAKQFSMVTDGMVSLRLSAEMTAKAISSGMSPDQFLELGKVAKGASQALGINMDDAVSRLTRGIVKLEPELLDELGLFTKLDKAVGDYARQVGKSESQLSDFERRQAFANAVLKEGKDKFGEIAQEGNPYDQLLASLKNVAQDILSIVNTIVGPIAKLLANNTELIALAIGLAVTKITKQAIPIFSNWQTKLLETAETARKTAADTSEAFASSLWNKRVAQSQVPQIDKDIENITSRLKTAQEKLAGSGASKEFKGRQWFSQATSSMEMTDKTREKLNDNIAKYTDSQVKNLKDFSSLAKEVVNLEAERNTKLLQRKKLLDEIEDRPEFKRYGLRDIISKDTASTAASLTLMSGVPEKVTKEGLKSGLAGFYNDVNASKDLSNLDKFSTKAKGTFIGLAQQASLVGKAFSAMLGPLQYFVFAFYALDAAFSKNAKSIQALEQSVDSMEEATKTAKNTAEKYMGVLSSANVVAISNNFNGLTSSITASSKAFLEFEKNSSVFDKIKEFFKGNMFGSAAAGAALGFGIGSAVPIIGQGIGAGLGAVGGALYGLSTEKEKTKAAESAADLLLQAVKTAPEGEIRDNLEKKLSAALGGVTLSKKAITQALESGDYAKLAEELGKVLKETDNILEKSKILVKNVEESTKKQTQSYQSLANSVRDNSPLTVFLMDTLKRTQDLQMAMGDTRASIAALESLAESGPAFIGLTGEQASQLSTIVAQYDVLREEEKAYRDEIKKRAADFEKATGKTVEEYVKKYGEDSAKVGSNMELQRLRADEKAVANIQKKIQELSGEVAAIAQGTVAKTMDLMIDSSTKNIRKIGIEASKSMVGLAGESVEGTRIQTKLDIEAISIEKELASVNRQLVMSMELGRISTDKLRDAYLLTYYNQRLADKNISNEEKSRIQLSVKGIEQRQTTFGKDIEGPGGNVITMEDRIREASKAGPEAVSALIKETGATAFQTILPIMLQASTAEVQAGLRIAAAQLQGIVKEQVIIVADDLKAAESGYKQLSSRMSSFTMGLTGGFSQLINNFVQDARDLVDLKKIEGQIAIQQKIIDSTTDKNVIAAAQGAKNRLAIEQSRLTTEQNLSKAIRDKNAELQISIDKTRALGELAAAAAEAQMRLVNTTTSEGMKQAETLRQKAFASRQGAENRVFAIQTEELRNRIQELSAERAIAMQDGNMGGYAFDQTDQGRELGRLQRALAGQTEIRALTSGAAAERNTAEGKVAIIDIAVKQYDELITKTNTARDLEQQRFDISQSAASAELQRGQQRLQFEQSLGLLTGQQIQDRTLLQEKAKIDLQLQTDLRNITNELTLAEQAYQRVKTQEQVAGRSFFNDQEGYVESPAERQAREQAEAARTKAATATAATKDAAAANKNFLDEQANLSDRQKAYAQQFNQAFQGMAQSIIDFAKTGKLEFKGLITSLIEGLIKYELQLQMTAMYSATVRPLLFGGVKAIGTAVMSAFTGTPTPTAMGAAYSGGIKSYAMGGTFTNQIVNKPTLFKAANGLGLMGEAGPEAIMPLQRDSRGRLGVSGGSNDVSVVVNNYGKERAEVKESTDGRGNRRIEVVVGEMVAGEMTRVGSPLQQTFTNNYGLAMPVGRR